MSEPIQAVLDELQPGDRVPDHPDLPDDAVGRTVRYVDDGVPIANGDGYHQSKCDFLVVDGWPTCGECGDIRLNPDAGDEGDWVFP